jgi:hypothetical protein
MCTLVRVLFFQGKRCIPLLNCILQKFFTACKWQINVEYDTPGIQLRCSTWEIKVWVQVSRRENWTTTLLLAYRWIPRSPVQTWKFLATWQTHRIFDDP